MGQRGRRKMPVARTTTHILGDLFQMSIWDRGSCLFGVHVVDTDYTACCFFAGVVLLLGKDVGLDGIERGRNRFLLRQDNVKKTWLIRDRLCWYGGRIDGGDRR
jgi:hypothetical protein